MITLALLILGCGSDYALTPAPERVSSAPEYQARVLAYVCDSDAACEAERAFEWGFCLSGVEVLPVEPSTSCAAIMAATPGGLLPWECLVSRVVEPSREDGEPCEVAL